MVQGSLHMASFENWSRVGLVCLSLLLGCRHHGGDAVDVPDGRVDVLTDGSGEAPAGAKLKESGTADPKTFDPRLTLDIDGQGSPSIGEHWKAGGTEMTIREIKAASDCDGASGASTECTFSEEWQIIASDRSLIHRSCHCGDSKEPSKKLSLDEYQKVEERILGLAKASNPTPCTADAPDVKVELRSTVSEKVTYAVNYGQCASSFAPRIDLKSFEALIEVLNQIKL